MSKDIFLSWSGGKDSSLALYEIQKANSHNVAALITTITAPRTALCVSKSTPA